MREKQRAGLMIAGGLALAGAIGLGHLGQEGLRRKQGAQRITRESAWLRPDTSAELTRPPPYASGELPSTTHARTRPRQLLFLGKRLLMRTPLGEVYASDDRGKSWTVTDFPVTSDLHVANHTELWSVRGWMGIHEGPSSDVWHSTDGGAVWARERRTPPQDATMMPRELINEAGQAPVALMMDHRLRRVVPGIAPQSWPPIGLPAPGEADQWGAGSGTAIQAGRSLYFAGNDALSLSVDEGATWSTLPTGKFRWAKLACDERACWALLTQDGSKGSALYRTPVGSNAWRPHGSLERDSVAAAVADQTSERGPWSHFAATDMAIRGDRVALTFVIDAGRKSSWGGVLFVDGEGRVSSARGAVPGGTYPIAIAPDAEIIVGGEGVFRVGSQGFEPLWQHPLMKAP